MTDFKDTKFFISEIFLENRKLAIEYLLQIKYQISLKKETFFLAVEIMDKVFLKLGFDLSANEIFHVGFTSLWIANKFLRSENNFRVMLIQLLVNKISREEIITLEIKILKILKFKIPKVYFLEFVQKNSQKIPNFEHLYPTIHTTYVFTLYDFILTNYFNLKKLFSGILILSSKIYNENNPNEKIVFNIDSLINDGIEKAILFKRINFVNFFKENSSDIKCKFNTFINFKAFELGNIHLNNEFEKL